MKKLLRVGAVLVALSLFAAIAVVFSVDVAPLRADAIRRSVDEINEAAAVSVPHGFDDGAVRTEHLSLFEKVEAGGRLSESESAQYRKAFQEIIYRKQSTLRRFDRSLTVLTDVDMAVPNNVGGTGIAGSHDHHDASVRANTKAIIDNVARLNDPATSSIGKVRAVVAINKDVSDILTHLATVPHTKSTSYSARPALEAIGRSSEAILRDFKRAQFEPVNSPEYWNALELALDRFDALLLYLDEVERTRLSPLERRLAGRWGSPQSLGPWLTKGTAARRYRPFAAAE